MPQPTQLVSESLDGGLVTARDQAMLGPGELALANNAYYLPNDPAIHKVKGRTKYNAVAITGGSTVKGLRYLEFDDGDPLLLALTSDDLSTSSFLAETGTFSTPASLTDVGNGVSLDAVQFQNRYVALIGTTGNLTINQNGIGRRHGLNPVPSLPTGNETGAPAVQSSGSWNAQLGTGFYYFVTTEVWKDGQGQEIESTFTGTPATGSTALLLPSSQTYLITKPTTVNASATHWRVYMSFPQDNPTPIPALSTFRFVAEADISNTTLTIGNVGSTGGKFPTANTTLVGGWSNPNNAHSDNNTGTRSSTDLSDQYYNTFAFSAPSGTVQGIEVEVKFRIPDYLGILSGSFARDSPKIILDLFHNTSGTYTPGSNKNYIICRDIPGSVANYVTVRLGSPTEKWGQATWASGDITSANFGVRLRYGLVNSTSATNAIVDVDYIKIYVYTNVSVPSVNLDGKPFRTVNISVAGITASVGADGPPPVASTGDIFEGQLVLNDTQDPSIIRYSLPDLIESFPSVYFLNFETKTQDSVTQIRRLGNKLIVGLKQQLYRVNYLPRETDAEFDRGRAYEAISETEGIVGTQAATLFSPDGGPLFLAYVSHLGPRYTDGFQTFSLTDDLDWPSTVRLPSVGDIVNYLDDCILVNYPALSQLWLYYTPPGATSNTKALVFHYNKQHRKEGGTFKVTGPVDVSAASACNGRLAGNDVLLTGQASGFVYVEDRGYTHNAGGTIAFSVKTREIYPGGWGETDTVESLYIRHRQNTSPDSTVTVTPYTRFQASAQVTQATKTFATTNGGLARLFPRHNFESIQWGFTEPGADSGNGVRLSGIAMELKSTGSPERTS